MDEADDSEISLSLGEVIDNGQPERRDDKREYKS